MSSNINSENSKKKAFRWQYFEMHQGILRCKQCFIDVSKNPNTYAIGCSNSTLRVHVDEVHSQLTTNAKITKYINHKNNDENRQHILQMKIKKKLIRNLILLED